MVAQLAGIRPGLTTYACATLVDDTVTCCAANAASATAFRTRSSRIARWRTARLASSGDIRCHHAHHPYTHSAVAVDRAYFDWILVDLAVASRHYLDRRCSTLRVRHTIDEIVSKTDSPTALTI